MKRRLKSCHVCKRAFRLLGDNPGVYCSRACKAEWQRTSPEWSEHGRKYALSKPPLDKEQLIKKYIKENKSTWQVAREMNCSQWRVVNWLKRYGIKARPKGFVYRKGWHHSVKTKRKLSEIAKADGRVPYDPKVGSYMKGRKGSDTPNWKGGVTPERQAFYSTIEWRRVERLIKKRDDLTCQRCGKCKRNCNKESFDIHHIVSFAYKPLRCEPTNLVLLCEKCHYWVHGPKNKKKTFIKEIPCPNQGVRNK